MKSLHEKKKKKKSFRYWNFDGNLRNLLSFSVVSVAEPEVFTAGKEMERLKFSGFRRDSATETALQPHWKLIIPQFPQTETRLKFKQPEIWWFSLFQKDEIQRSTRKFIIFYQYEN